MTFSELAKERYSCRMFKDEEVSQKDIDKIIETALAAPTAVNKQPQKILIINDKKIIENLKECTRFTFDAPLIFVILADKEKAWTRKYDGKNAADIDGAIVTTHMMLQAQELGLGTTWVMAFDPYKARSILNIPEKYEIIALLPTGHPADDVKISPMHNESVTAEEIVSYNEL